MTTSLLSLSYTYMIEPQDCLNDPTWPEEGRLVPSQRNASQHLRTIKMSSRQGRSRKYEDSGGGRQTGLAYDIEADEVEPSSSQQLEQQVVAELNAANLARVNEQPQVPGPLKLLEVQSDLARASVHTMFEEIDRLNLSIQSHRDTIDFLRGQIATAKSAEQWTKVEELEGWETNTFERIQQEQERKQVLLDRLGEQGQLLDDGLRAQGLATTSAGWQSNYPTRADMAEDTEGVPEEARPHMNF